MALAPVTPKEPDLIDRALDEAAVAQMVHLFGVLIAEESLTPTAMGQFEKGLRELIAAYDAVHALIEQLKIELPH